MRLRDIGDAWRLLDESPPAPAPARTRTAGTHHRGLDRRRVDSLALATPGSPSSTTASSRPPPKMRSFPYRNAAGEPALGPRQRRHCITRWPPRGVSL